MNKVILVNEEKLEKLLEVISSCYWNDCPEEVFGERPSWCNEEYCINKNCGEYGCIKKWLDVKELPQRKPIYYEVKTNEVERNIGFNKCIDEILGEE